MSDEINIEAVSETMLDEFNKLTDTGKYKAIMAERNRADGFQDTLNIIQRHLMGMLLMLTSRDELIARLMKGDAKKDKK